jgi:hypothetical protein
MRNKRNLIQEIKRINSINLGKEIINEQEGPILDVITTLVRRGSNDVETKSLITKLNGAQTKGQRISLLSQLRKSKDIEISKLVKSLDNDILQDLETIITRIANNRSVRGKITKDIQNGISREDSINNIIRRFQETYRDYANDFVNPFSGLLGKTYDDISATINPPKPPEPNPVPNPVPPIPNPSDSTSILRKFFRDLLSKNPELQTNLRTFQISASSKVNKVKALIEEYATPGLDGSRIQEIEDEVRKLMVELRKEDLSVMNQIKDEIDNGSDNAITYSEKTKWKLLKNAYEGIEKKGASFGYIEKLAPKGGSWLTISEGVKYAFAWERKILLKIARRLGKTWIGDAWKGLREKSGQKIEDLNLVTSPFTGLKKFAATSTFPGSLRGIPKGAPTEKIEKVGNTLKSKTTIESGYKEIYNLQKSPELKAWASLAIEKIIKVVKFQLYAGVLNALVTYVKYLYQSDREIQDEYANCIIEVGKAIDNGDISINEEPDPEKIPTCLLKIIEEDKDIYNFPGSSWFFGDDYTKEELVKAIVIRAYLQRGAETGENGEFLVNAFIKPVLEPIMEITLGEGLINLFGGYLPSWAWEFWSNYVPNTILGELTGSSTGLDQTMQDLMRRAEQARTELETDTGIEIEEVSEYVGPDFD